MAANKVDISFNGQKYLYRIIAINLDLRVSAGNTTVIIMDQAIL